jgi:hypothetical protein
MLLVLAMSQVLFAEARPDSANSLDGAKPEINLSREKLKSSATLLARLEKGFGQWKSLEAKLKKDGQAITGTLNGVVVELLCSSLNNVPVIKMVIRKDGVAILQDAKYKGDFFMVADVYATTPGPELVTACLDRRSEKSEIRGYNVAVYTLSGKHEGTSVFMDYFCIKPSTKDGKLPDRTVLKKTAETIRKLTHLDRRKK